MVCAAKAAPLSTVQAVRASGQALPHACADLYGGSATLHGMRSGGWACSCCRLLRASATNTAHLAPRTPTEFCTPANGFIQSTHMSIRPLLRANTRGSVVASLFISVPPNSDPMPLKLSSCCSEVGVSAACRAATQSGLQWNCCTTCAVRHTHSMGPAQTACHGVSARLMMCACVRLVLQQRRCPGPGTCRMRMPCRLRPSTAALRVQSAGSHTTHLVQPEPQHRPKGLQD